MKLSIQITVLILVLFILTLGYLISMQPNKGSSTNSLPTFSAGSSTPPLLSQTVPVPVPPTSLPGNVYLSNDHALVLVFPDPNASEEERTKHNQLVLKLAQVADILLIKGCKPNPLVLRVSLQKDFTIKNDDIKERSIHLRSVDLKIPAHGSLFVRSSKTFDKGPGNYGYLCDNALSTSGIFQVIR